MTKTKSNATRARSDLPSVTDHACVLMDGRILAPGA